MNCIKIIPPASTRGLLLWSSVVLLCWQEAQKREKIRLYIFFIVAEWHLVVTLRNCSSVITDVTVLDVTPSLLQCQAASLVTWFIFEPFPPPWNSWDSILFYSWARALLSSGGKNNCSCSFLKGTCTGVEVHYSGIVWILYTRVVTLHYLDNSLAFGRLQSPKRPTGRVTEVGHLCSCLLIP